MMNEPITTDLTKDQILELIRTTMNRAWGNYQNPPDNVSDEFAQGYQWEWSTLYHLTDRLIHNRAVK